MRNKRLVSQVRGRMHAKPFRGKRPSPVLTFTETVSPTETDFYKTWMGFLEALPKVPMVVMTHNRRIPKRTVAMV